MPSSDPHAMQPRVAWKALKELIANPEDTEKVFVIVRALSGKTLLRGYNRFVKTEVGQKILDERRELVDTLLDREALAQLPEGSLGRHYLHFVSSENISADGLVDASEIDDREFDNENIARYGNRLRDQHDLWHVLTQYGRDVTGEACLLAFTVAQTWNPGLALIALAGVFKIGSDNDWRVARASWSAWRAGRRAAWLPAQDWEALLAQPIDEVREQLGLVAPEVYPELREAYAT